MYRYGEEAGGIYGIIRGRVELHLPYLKEEKSLCHIAGPGYWFGDLSAVSGESRKLEVRATEQSLLLRLSRAELMRFLAETPEAWKHVTHMMAANLELTLRYLEAMKAEDALARIKAILEILGDQELENPNRIPISQNDLAAIAGLSRKSTGTALQRLQSLGKIVVHYRSIELADRR